MEYAKSERLHLFAERAVLTKVRACDPHPPVAKEAQRGVRAVALTVARPRAKVFDEMSRGLDINHLDEENQTPMYIATVRPSALPPRCLHRGAVPPSNRLTIAH